MFEIKLRKGYFVLFIHLLQRDYYSFIIFRRLKNIGVLIILLFTTTVLVILIPLAGLNV